jgi:hypothetical protein
MNVSVVIPTFNEAKNLERLINHILCLYPKFSIIIMRKAAVVLAKKWLTKIISFYEIFGGDVSSS